MCTPKALILDFTIYISTILQHLDTSFTHFDLLTHFLNNFTIHNKMSSMTQTRQQVYVSDGFSEPMSAQHNFANNFDLDNPDAAMSAYQRYVPSAC
jgi:arginine/lysine/ornithine decarboxylase